MTLLERYATTQVPENAPVAYFMLREAVPEEPPIASGKCSSCSLRTACLPCDLLAPRTDAGQDAGIVQRGLKRGEYLYRHGDEFRFLFTLRSGCLKTVQNLEGGREQVTGFYMAGDLLGVDGIGPRIYGSDAIALEDSRVCLIPYGRIERPAPRSNRVLRALHRAMSAEIVRQHGVMLLLGTRSAEERVAAFLLDLSERFLARGYSPSKFHLRMTRRDIGSFLGLKLETVSRIFSRFRDDGLVGVERRNIFLRDLAGLRRCMSAESDPIADQVPASAPMALHTHGKSARSACFSP